MDVVIWALDALAQAWLAYAIWVGDAVFARVAPELRPAAMVLVLLSPWLATLAAVQVALWKRWI